jgi:hypothetical protein
VVTDMSVLDRIEQPDVESDDDSYYVLGDEDYTPPFGADRAHSLAAHAHSLVERWRPDPVDDLLHTLEDDGRVEEARVIESALRELGRQQALRDLRKRRAAMATRARALRAVRPVYDDSTEAVEEQAATARALASVQRRAASEV